MEYLSLVRGIIGEALRRTQYKHLGRPWSVLAFIGVLPFVIASVLCTVFAYTLLFFYHGLISGIEYLEAWVKEQRRDVRHATEAVLYLVSMPIIFLLRVCASFFSIFFYFLWFVLSVVFYVATLGGIRFQPFIASATYDREAALVPVTKENKGHLLAALLFVTFALGVAITLLLMKMDEPTDLIDTLKKVRNVALIAWGGGVVVLPFVFRLQKEEIAPKTTSSEAFEGFSDFPAF